MFFMDMITKNNDVYQYFLYLMHCKQIMGRWEGGSISNKAARTGEQNKDPYICHTLISRQKKISDT